MINFLWDFSVYHNRWDDIKETFFSNDNSKEKGALTLNEVAESSADRLEYSKDFGSFAGDNLGAEYLCSMIEELQEKGIRVVLTYIPVSCGRGLYKGIKYD